MRADVDALTTALTSRTDASLRWRSAHYPDETHDSTGIKSYYDGLRMIFAGYNYPRDAKRNLLVGSLDDVKSHFAKLGEQLGVPFGPPELIVNELGYQCLQAGRSELAVAAFRFNTEQHPQSANAWDSLAEEAGASRRGHRGACSVSKGSRSGGGATAPKRGGISQASLAPRDHPKTGGAALGLTSRNRSGELRRVGSPSWEAGFVRLRAPRLIEVGRPHPIVGAALEAEHDDTTSVSPMRCGCRVPRWDGFTRTNSTVVTFGSGDMTADFTCRPLSTITKLCTMGGTGTGGCHCIVPVQLELDLAIRAEDSVVGRVDTCDLPVQPLPCPESGTFHHRRTSSSPWRRTSPFLRRGRVGPLAPRRRRDRSLRGA